MIFNLTKYKTDYSTLNCITHYPLLSNMSPRYGHNLRTKNGFAHRNYKAFKKYGAIFIIIKRILITLLVYFCVVEPRSLVMKLNIMQSVY